jgi:hypothetical protein
VESVPKPPAQIPQQQMLPQFILFYLFIPSSWFRISCESAQADSFAYSNKKFNKNYVLNNITINIIQYKEAIDLRTCYEE